MISQPPLRPPLAAGDELGRAFKWSVISHAALLIIILIKSLVFPGKPIIYLPTLRVDIVGLPDILKSDLNKVPKASRMSPERMKQALKEAEIAARKIEASKEVAEPDELVLKPKTQPKNNQENREKKLKAALQRIKALAKLQKQDATGDSSNAGVLIKGNKISKGTSLTGEARETAEASYFDLIRNRLQENWALPVWIARQKYSAQVELFIDRRGMVKAFKFSKFSGNAQFDDAVKRTIAQSQPFSAPPAEIARSIEFNGISVGFPL